MHSKSAMKVTVMPAAHGDCILVQCGDFNVLVDAGPSNAKVHARVHAALTYALSDQPIHLAIVTHNDDDHIGGLDRILESSALSIRTLLFNSPQRLREYIDRHDDQEIRVSARQALRVARKLNPCNAKVVIAEDELKFFDDKITLRILSPLGEDILKYGPRMLATIGAEELAGTRGRETPVCGTVGELMGMDDDDIAYDPSESNALSLAFILTFEERSILFLGDSSPSRVTPVLAKLHAAGSRIPLDLVFVSHHGSKNNTTTELYRHIETGRYVISADGKQNPDVATFGRILRAKGETSPKFYFSENSEQLAAMFSESDIDARFPGDVPLTLTL